MFHGVTRQPGNVLKEVETSEGRVLQFQVTGMIEWGQKLKPKKKTEKKPHAEFPIYKISREH